MRNLASGRKKRTARDLLSSARPATLAERAERAPSLDRPVRALAEMAVHALPPGRRADVLHGVPFGQPAHPALAGLPIGCWTSAVLLDLVGGEGSRRAAATLVATGVAGALPAAASGVADWSALHRHQQRVGLIHALSQLGGTALFAASLAARAAGRPGGGKALSACGLAVAAAGGYLGGHLALRLGAGASHAEPVGHLAPLGWQDLCPFGELPDGTPVRRQLGYLSLLAVREGPDVRVLSDQCAHLGGPLHQGRLVRVRADACVACPWHGSTFRLGDGTVLHGPATARQPGFETRISDSGWVQVRPRTGAGAARRGRARSRGRLRKPGMPPAQPGSAASAAG